jgi:hypothetical protein
MSLLTSFINPSTLLCLGIVAFVGGLLYIHIESKSREQNHKISSMLSLVSSLADEVNSIKHVLNNNRHPNTTTLRVNEDNNRLIDVSDGSDSESELDSDEESDSELEPDSDNESELDSDDEESETRRVEIEIDNSKCILDTIDSTIKVLKLDIGAVLNNTEDEQSSSDDLESELSFDELPLDDPDKETISTYDLKTIQLTNLEDISTVVVDYKKMSVPMLRSVIKDKKLSNDPSKLKKPELLKLLGC